MKESNLLIYSQEQSLKCCTLCSQHPFYLLAASNTCLFLFDLTKNKKISTISLPINFDPISINHIFAPSTYLLQGKSGQISTYELQKMTLAFNNSYVIPPLGFTKLCYLQTKYHQTTLHSYFPQYFYLPIPPTTISLLRTANGQSCQQFQCSIFSDPSCMIAYTINAQNYVLLAQEGCLLKQYETNRQVSEMKIQKEIRLQLQCSEQIKIVLSMGCMKEQKGIVCVRGGEVYIIKLKELTVVQMIQVMPSLRLCWVGHKHTWVCSKSKIGRLEREKLTNVEKISTNLIVDLCGGEEGVVGVTDDGKIFIMQ